MLSYLENIPSILQAVKESKAKNILDCGPGFGKYGLLIREQYLSSKAKSGDLSPKDDLLIVGCELTPYFITPRLDAIYDGVIQQDFMELKEPTMKRFELALLIDVVEHYPKDKIKEWIERTKTPVLISTPQNVTMYEEHYYGDPHHHCSQWQTTDFIGLGGRAWKNYSTPLSHIWMSV